LSSTKLAKYLPAAGYLAPLSKFSFRRKYSVVSDQLVAPKTNYVDQRQLITWFAAAGLKDIKVGLRNGNSWRARGSRPSTDEITPTLRSPEVRKANGTTLNARSVFSRQQN
jgi:hypothetical protein